ncbi:hypothetical protein IMZ48_25950 [Candidatus Bathyarchaeota archaeon]|nr:hypothetical protein [Candidatus Bathyarchaeota archaeon]
MILLCDGKGYVVECHQHGIHTEFEPGDFSSSCYPFESDREKKPYIENNKTDPTRRATSIKPIFLVLADIPRRRLRPLLSEYPHADEILERLDSEDRPFRQRLHAAIAGFCDALRKRLVALCNKEELRVVSVGISVPSQWPAEVEDFMADVFVAKLLKRAECVQVSRDQILFHSETQALAHNVFKEAGRLLEPRGTTMKGFLLLDFGGQNLVSSVYS